MFAERALYLALTQDTLSATLASGSTTTVLQLASGGAAAWTVDDWLNLTGAGATAANHRRVARVAEVDEVLDRLTLDRPLPVAPAAGNTIGAGYLQWVRPVVGGQKFAEDLLYNVARADDQHPAVGILAQETDPRVVVLYGEIASRRESFTATLERWRFRIISRDPRWAVAAETRIHAILDGRRGALSIPGRSVYSIDAHETTPQLRDDVLIEKHTQVAIVTSSAEAA